MQLKKDFKLGRNKVCQCGSGKKYKKCCLKIEQDQISFKMLENRRILEKAKKNKKEEK